MAVSEREVHTELRGLLINNTPLQYAHLIKFERPSRPDEKSGRISTSAQRYTYLTDASRDVEFNDLSTDLQGNANGTQIYIANKVLNISNIQESVKAKADTCSLTLDGNGIGGAVSGNVVITVVNSTTYDLQWPTNIDLVSNGFREGDKITLSGGRTGQFNIFKFRANNTVRLKKIDNSLTAGSASVTAILDSEEIKSILLNKNADDYASFINREVYIYRAYFQNGKLVGETPDIYGNIGPILLFRGIISNVSFEDDDSGIKVQWGLTSHWGDFAQVRGRITSDEFHRALDQNGLPQPDSAIKSIYAYDKGFSHAETSLNLLANYTVMVEKTDIKTKNGFFGIGAKTKVKTYLVPETRNSALDFQLQAKSLPVIYGVRSVPGMPIFADTLKTNSSDVYVAYALSEGQIGGIYDIIIEGKSLICNNKEDLDARGTQKADESVDLICRGRADRGDVLGGAPSIGSGNINYYYDPSAGVDLRSVWNHEFNRNAYKFYSPYIAPGADLPTTQSGIIHGESIKLTSPQEITLDFFSGTESQKAAPQLVSIAATGGFKVQNDYWKGKETAEYWGPNHRLIDTAYVVVKYKIKEGETTIPDLSFIIRGKVLDCYNYDYSYAHDDKITSENPNNFLLGDMVSLSTGQSVQIIDKWSFVRPDGVVETRFRFSVPPALGYINGIPTITRFTMTKGSFVWTMTTYNWIMHSGTVAEEIAADDPVVGGGGSGGIDVGFPGNPPFTGGAGGGNFNETQVLYSIINNDGTVHKNALLTGNIVGNTLQTEMV